MRTTLILDDALFRAAKKRALDRQSTLSEVVNDALRQLMSRTGSVARKSIKLTTFGDPKRKRNVTPQQIAAALYDLP